jgi:hypothetical protein
MYFDEVAHGSKRTLPRSLPSLLAVGIVSFALGSLLSGGRRNNAAQLPANKHCAYAVPCACENAGLSPSSSSYASSSSIAPTLFVAGCESESAAAAAAAASTSLARPKRTDTSTPSFTFERAGEQIAKPGENPSRLWKKAVSPIGPADMPTCKRLISPSFPKGDACLAGNPIWTYDEAANTLPVEETDMNDATLALHPRCHDLLRYTPTLPQLVSLNSGSRGVFGFDSTASLFAQADIIFMQYVLVAFPTARRLVEFGTASGSTSLWLGMTARVRGGRLWTIEYHGTDNRIPAVKAAWLPEMSFVEDDLLATKGVCKHDSPEEMSGSCAPCSRRIASYVATSDFLLIDNGQKIREAHLWAKFVPLGGVALVHDNTDTVWDKPYDAVFAAQGFTKVFTDIAHSVGTHLRAWRRDGPGNVGYWTEGHIDSVKGACEPFGYHG